MTQDKHIGNTSERTVLIDRGKGSVGLSRWVLVDTSPWPLHLKAPSHSSRQTLSFAGGCHTPRWERTCSTCPTSSPLSLCALKRPVTVSLVL